VTRFVCVHCGTLIGTTPVGVDEEHLLPCAECARKLSPFAAACTGHDAESPDAAAPSSRRESDLLDERGSWPAVRRRSPGLVTLLVVIGSILIPVIGALILWSRGVRPW